MSAADSLLAALRALADDELASYVRFHEIEVLHAAGQWLNDDAAARRVGDVSAAMLELGLDEQRRRGAERAELDLAFHDYAPTFWSTPDDHEDDDESDRLGRHEGIDHLPPDDQIGLVADTPPDSDVGDEE